VLGRVLDAYAAHRDMPFETWVATVYDPSLPPRLTVQADEPGCSEIRGLGITWPRTWGNPETRHERQILSPRNSF
jgi:hypothetical protein